MDPDDFQWSDLYGDFYPDDDESDMDGLHVIEIWELVLIDAIDRGKAREGQGTKDRDA